MKHWQQNLCQSISETSAKRKKREKTTRNPVAKAFCATRKHNKHLLSLYLVFKLGKFNFVPSISWETAYGCVFAVRP